MANLKSVRNRWNDPLSRRGWDEFESLVATYYRSKGWRVEHVGTGESGARFDGGIDLKLYKDDQYVVVQCKHWNAMKVPHNDVHQLIGVMTTQRATGAILITSGEYTTYAREAASKIGNVELVDGIMLRAMIGPLPEGSISESSSWRPLADAVADVAVDAVSRKFGWSKSPRKGGALSTISFAAVFFKIMMALVIGLLGLYMVNSAFNRLNDIGHRRQEAAAAAQKEARLQAEVESAAKAAQLSVAPPPAVMTTISDPITKAAHSSLIQDPKRGVLEFAPADQVMTEEELREWERRNAESVKILEAAAPELQN